MLYMLPTSSSMLGLPAWYGCITAPERWGRRPIEEGRIYCCDNGAFSGRFSPEKSLKTLEQLAPHARTHALIAAAKARGLWIHVGRVNSNKRIRHWRALGADSSDGTHSAFASLQNTVRLFNQSLAEQPLFQ